MDLEQCIIAAGRLLDGVMTDPSVQKGDPVYVLVHDAMNLLTKAVLKLLSAEA